MGDEVPLTWPDLLAYSQATGAVTSRDELVTLFEMSKAYAAGKIHGTQPAAMSPAEQLENGLDE